MNLMTEDEFIALCFQKDIAVIKCMKDKRPRVLEKKTGEIIKIFYPSKKWGPKNKHKKSCLRFCKNALLLNQCHLSAPEVTGPFYCKTRNAYLLCYKKLPGRNVRALVQETGPGLLLEVMQFTAQLHQLGIFFRSLHLENLLYQPPNHFGLIDIAEVGFKKRPLDFFRRYRNLRHMFLVRQDKPIWQKKGYLYWTSQYCENAKLSGFSKKLILFFVFFKMTLVPRIIAGLKK